MTFAVEDLKSRLRTLKDYVTRYKKNKHMNSAFQAKGVMAFAVSEIPFLLLDYHKVENCVIKTEPSTESIINSKEAELGHEREIEDEFVIESTETTFVPAACREEVIVQEHDYSEKIEKAKKTEKKEADGHANFHGD